MKATVMESNNGMSVILTEDGVFRTVVGSYEVGSEIRYGTPVNRRRLTSRIAAVAACLLMALSMGTYSYQNLMVYATVTLDGTAPIQMDLNRHDKVIGVKAIDEAGEALAAQLLDSGIKGEHFETALARAEQMIARANEGDKISILPHVQCKSSDKIKALTDMIRQEESASKPAAGSDPTVSTEPSGIAPTAEKPTDKPTDKPSESTAASETGTEAEPTASSGTEPSSEEGMNPQDEGENMDAQDESQGENMDAQETDGQTTESMSAQEAADPAGEPAAAAAPAPETTDAAKAPTKDNKETSPAETPAEGTVE